MYDESSDSNDNNDLTAMTRSGAKKRIRKLQLKWTSQQTERLIEKVFERETLWNSALKVGDDRLLRKSLWEQVAKEMTMSRSEVTTKWNSLRSSFRSAFIKRENAISSGQNVKKACNKFYNSLRFLEADMYRDDSPGRNLSKNRLNSPLSVKSSRDSRELSSLSSLSSPSSVAALSPLTIMPVCIKSTNCSRQESDPLESRRSSLRASSSRMIVSPLSIASSITSATLLPAQSVPAPKLPAPPPSAPPSNFALQKRHRHNKKDDVKYNNVLDLVLETMNGVVSKSDIWDTVGSFVASNGREWATTNPKLANEYKSAIYKTVADFQQRTTEPQEQSGRE